MPLRYAVECALTIQRRSTLKLNEAADNGGRVVKVIWQPERELTDMEQPDFKLPTPWRRARIDGE
ncbi:MAG: hypothetical protein EOS57_08185 [Mesorhizobium sp.]|nr:MAG: hypothetical protein EOS57_08185 [Mesorhizobium sp.]